MASQTPAEPGGAPGHSGPENDQPDGSSCGSVDSAHGGAHPDVPADFAAVSEALPTWIDIPGICKEAKRFVALHAMSTFNAIAINDGQRVFTASDRGGEFRRLFGRVVGDIGRVIRIDPKDAALVYDCNRQLQWVAPRPSAIRFLTSQL